MPRRTPEELWAALEEQFADDEMDEVLAMTPEERRRELEAAGYDLNKVHAEADAFAEQFRRGEHLTTKTASGTFSAAPAMQDSPKK